METKLLTFRRRDKRGDSRDDIDGELTVDPALPRIAERQREALRLKAEQSIAAELPRLRLAVEELLASLRSRRRIA